MTIIPDDYTFATTNEAGSPVAFATAGDCFSAGTDTNCRKGSFMIDLTGTGLRVKNDVKWIVQGDIPGMQIANYENNKGIMISANCGGWCGHCRPETSLKLELANCHLKLGKYTDFCHRH